jgi:hypothetical protein
MIGQRPQERFSRDRRTLFDLGSLWLSGHFHSSVVMR